MSSSNKLRQELLVRRAKTELRWVGSCDPKIQVSKHDAQKKFDASEKLTQTRSSSPCIYPSSHLQEGNPGRANWQTKQSLQSRQYLHFLPEERERLRLRETRRVELGEDVRVRKSAWCSGDGVVKDMRQRELGGGGIRDYSEEKEWLRLFDVDVWYTVLVAFYTTSPERNE